MTNYYYCRKCRIVFFKFFSVTFCEPFEKLIKAIHPETHSASNFPTILECLSASLKILPHTIDFELKPLLWVIILQLMSVCSPIPPNNMQLEKINLDKTCELSLVVGYL